VTAVEHDLDWVDSLRPRIGSNTVLLHRAAGIDAGQLDVRACERFFSMDRRTEWEYPPERVVRRGLDDEQFVAYASEVGKHGAPFDIIVIDGMARRLCTFFAIDHLARDGMIVFDNANRSDYDLSYRLLAEAGFRQVPFWGLVPGADFHTCTSIFIRSIDRLADAAWSPSLLGLPEY
jgi:hypothetical protein